VLTIARVSKSDAGKYECKAVSVTDEKVCASAHVTVTNEQPPSRFDNSSEYHSESCVYIYQSIYVLYIC
jgi:hypothetical protein